MRTSRWGSPFSACRRGRCARRGRAARRSTGRGTFSPAPRWGAAAADAKQESHSGNERRHPGCCSSGSRRLAHRFVHLELDVALEAEQLVLARGGQSLGAVRQQQEVVEEEGPQLPGAFGFLEAAAVQQPARPQAAGQRVKNQVLQREESDNGVLIGGIFSFTYACLKPGLFKPKVSNSKPEPGHLTACKSFQGAWLSGASGGPWKSIQEAAWKQLFLVPHM